MLKFVSSRNDLCLLVENVVSIQRLILSNTSSLFLACFTIQSIFSHALLFYFLLLFKFFKKLILIDFLSKRHVSSLQSLTFYSQEGRKTTVGIRCQGKGVVELDTGELQHGLLVLLLYPQRKTVVILDFVHQFEECL